MRFFFILNFVFLFQIGIKAPEKVKFSKKRIIYNPLEEEEDEEPFLLLNCLLTESTTLEESNCVSGLFHLIHVLLT
jgi:hypothetical protein